MVRTKWTYHKERSFARNYLTFLKILFQFEHSYKELIWCTNDPNLHIHTFCERWSFIWRCFSPVSILKKISYKLFLQELLKFVLDFVLGLIRKSMHIYQTTNTLSQSHNQLQNNNIHINFFIFSLWQMQ